MIRVLSALQNANLPHKIRRSGAVYFAAALAVAGLALSRMV